MFYNIYISICSYNHNSIYILAILYIYYNDMEEITMQRKQTYTKDITQQIEHNIARSICGYDRYAYGRVVMAIQSK